MNRAEVAVSGQHDGFFTTLCYPHFQMPFPILVIGVFTVIAFSTLAFTRLKRTAHPRHAKDAANPKRHKAEYVPRGVFFRGHVNTTDEDFAYLKSWSAALDFTAAQAMFAGPRGKMERCGVWAGT